MYRLIVSITFLLFSCNKNQKDMKDTSINIIPKPTSIKKSNQYFDLNSIKGINIENNSKYEKHIAELFKNYLKPKVWNNKEIYAATTRCALSNSLVVAPSESSRSSTSALAASTAASAPSSTGATSPPPPAPTPRCRTGSPKPRPAPRPRRRRPAAAGGVNPP